MKCCIKISKGKGMHYFVMNKTKTKGYAIEVLCKLINKKLVNIYFLMH